MDDSHVRKLLETCQLDKRDADLVLKSVRSPGFWRLINPQLSVTESRAPIGLPYQESHLDDAIRHLADRGYAKLEMILSVVQTNILYLGIQKINKVGLPGIFIYLYDEVWQMALLPPLRDLFTSILGSDYTLLPNIWFHQIEGRAGATGFSPHVDGGLGEPLAVNMWVPLTAAGLRTSPIYAVRRTPENRDAQRRFERREVMTNADVSQLLHSTRALPANPGDVLLWDTRLVHWGSLYHEGKLPRLSLSITFGAKDWTGKNKNAHALSTATMPTFAERMRLIAHEVNNVFQTDSLFKFSAQELELWRFRPVIDRLLDLQVVQGQAL